MRRLLAAAVARVAPLLAGRWAAVAGALAVAALVAWGLASLRGCSAERTERDRLLTDRARSADAAGPGAQANLAAERARLDAAKDEEIRRLRRQVQDLTCEGTWIETLWPDGRRERRCERGMKLHSDESGDDAAARRTPAGGPAPFSPPPPLPALAAARRATLQLLLAPGKDISRAGMLGQAGLLVRGPRAGLGVTATYGRLGWGVYVPLTIDLFPPKEAR